MAIYKRSTGVAKSMGAAIVLASGCAALAAAGAESEIGGTLAFGDRAALKMALDDEYKAEATYAAVLSKFADARPFVNIIEAERRHAAMVVVHYQTYGMAVPANPYLGQISAPDTLLGACELGRDAEIENIALYDRIIPTVENAAIQQTLTQLQWASREKHLPAFQRCIDRGGTLGGGQGRGKGRGGMGKGDGLGRDGQGG